MSFSLLAVRRMRLLAPASRVFLMEACRCPFRDGSLPPGVRHRRDRPSRSCGSPEYVGAAARARHTVHVWTVDEPDDVDRCRASADVDAIITNRPADVLAQLGR